MIRFVLDPQGRLVPDLAGRLPGRGLWIVPRRDMIARAIQKRLFAKAAKAAVELPPDLEEQLEQLMRRRCLDTLALARRAGEAVAGHDRVQGWLERGRVAVLLEAKDASEAGRKRMLGLAKAIGDGPAVYQLFSAAELGRTFGRDNAVHVAVAEGGLAAKLRCEAARLEEFTDGERGKGPGSRMERHGKR
jgi:predicted RNA-binding protein YlxR (DUF448 family)